LIVTLVAVLGRYSFDIQQTGHVQGIGKSMAGPARSSRTSPRARSTTTKLGREAKILVAEDDKKMAALRRYFIAK
jgi:hypothetical protein